MPLQIANCIMLGDDGFFLLRQLHLIGSGRAADEERPHGCDHQQKHHGEKGREQDAASVDLLFHTPASLLLVPYYT